MLNMCNAIKIMSIANTMKMHTLFFHNMDWIALHSKLEGCNEVVMEGTGNTCTRK